MFSLRDNDLGFEKRVDDNIPIYSFICSHKDYSTKMIDIIDDFRKNDYSAMVIDNNEKDKKTIKGYIPLAEEIIDNKIDYCKIGYIKDFSQRKTALLGVGLPVTAVVSYFVASNKMENPLLFTLAYSGLYAASAFIMPFIAKKIVKKDAEIFEGVKGFFPIFEAALNRSEFRTLNNS